MRPSLVTRGLGGSVGGLLVTRGLGTFHEVVDSFIHALRERLDGSDYQGYDVGATQVYLNKTLESPGGQYPFIIINWLNEYPDPLTNCTDGGPFTARVQFSVISDDDEEAMSIRDEAYRALAPGKPLLLFNDGVDRAHKPGMKWQYAQPGQKPGGKLVWNFAFDYHFLLERFY